MSENSDHSLRDRLQDAEDGAQRREGEAATDGQEQEPSPVGATAEGNNGTESSVIPAGESSDTQPGLPQEEPAAVKLPESSARGQLSSSGHAVRVVDLQKHYELGGETVKALQGVSFDVPIGDYIAIMGPSGSGKSTLLNLLGCLDRPTHGSFFLGDDDVAQLNDDRLSEIRASRLGFVFQSYNLIQQLTVVENIEVPLYYRGQITTKDHQRALELAKMVGLGDRLDHRPMQLSGGQQQRAAIARSLINDPYFILADEPTGNLDSVTTETILSLLSQLNEQGKTIIMVTHEDEVAERAKRIIRLRDGLIQVDKRIREL